MPFLRIAKWGLSCCLNLLPFLAGGRKTCVSFLSTRLPVFLAPWKKGLIAVVVIGVVIATLIVAAKCYFLRKAKGECLSAAWVSRELHPGGG
jgi:hypothetical protein